MNLPAKQLTVGLDCDGVLSDFYGSVLDALTELGQKPVSYGQLRSYDLNLSLGDKHADLARETLRDPSFWTALNELPGIHDAYRRLSSIADVFIVTSPWLGCISWEFARRTWLKRLSVHDDQVVFARSKHIIHADVFIDDHPGHVQAWASRHPSGLAILVDQPWNKELGQYGHAAANWQFNRADSFTSAVRLVEHHLATAGEH